MEYITTANVLAWVFLTIGVFMMLVGYWLAATALFPRHVQQCEAAFTRPFLISLLGLFFGVIPLILGIVVLKAAPAALKWIGLLSITVPILWGLVGSAGLARRIGAGMHSPRDTDQPWRAVLRGGVVLSLTLLLPVLGQLLLLPLILAAGLGASIVAWTRRDRRATLPIPPA